MGLVGVGGKVGSRAALPVNPHPSSGRSTMGGSGSWWRHGELARFIDWLCPPPVREMTLDILG